MDLLRKRDNIFGILFNLNFRLPLSHIIPIQYFFHLLKILHQFKQKVAISQLNGIKATNGRFGYCIGPLQDLLTVFGKVEHGCVVLGET